jgi:hypothetical protein
MNTFTVTTEETPAPLVTEKIFIKGLPVTHTPPGGEPVQAVYSHPMAYGDRHYIIFNAESSNPSELYVQGDHITPNRPLTDEEMVSYLTNELYEANEDADRFRKRIVRLVADVEVITEALRDEAESRGWCDDYNEFCSTVNANLSETHLLALEQEYEVDVEVEATVRTTRTISVLARSLEDAQEMVTVDPETFFDPIEEAIDAARAGGFDDLEVNLA